MARREIVVDPSDIAFTDEMFDAVAGFRDDPLGFVLFAFPWGEEGTALHDEPGPDEWQREFLEQLGEECRKRSLAPAGVEMPAILMAVASGHGVGKAQPKGLMLDTPSGLRRWGDLRPGDYVFGRDGRPTRIVAVHEQGRLPVFRVRLDDQTETVVCGEHLWTVRGRAGRRDGANAWEVLTTAQIAQRGVLRRNGAAQARQWELPVHGPVEYPFSWVPMEPYTLGVWLGDGGRKTAQFTSADPEVAAAIARLGGATLEARPTRGAASVVSIERGAWALRHLGVFECAAHEKFVPAAYKENIAEVRAAVLRGLLDTDGTVTPTGAVIFTSVSERLALDVAWLARSLGGKARMHAPRKTAYRRNDGELVQGRPAYNVTLTMPDGFRCFEIARKQDRVRPTTQKRYLARWIEAIEPVGDDDCMCITVDAADSLYLTNDFIVTHNSALVSWVILWFMSCRADPSVVVTANTQGQLTSKTWRELALWHRRAINAAWFTWTATTFYMSDRPETWKASAIPWTKEKAEAFAGTHAKAVLMLFDEASSIDDAIWTSADGAMTTAGAIWLAFGNPTRNSGRFRECFRRFRHRWITRQVDSRKARKANKAQIKAWIDDYGEESDFAKVRVRGEFPSSDVTQLISSVLVDAARAEWRRRVPGEKVVRAIADGPDAVSRLRLDVNGHAPWIFTIDVARFGSDQTVFGLRVGSTFVVLARFRGLDNVQVAFRAKEWIVGLELDAIIADEGGLGAGVVDILRHDGFDVTGVNSSVRAIDDRKYHNRRVEMWDRGKAWLARGGAIPADDLELADELVGPQYGFAAKGERLQLETKDDMKDRGLPSPDTADALMLSFAVDIAPRHARREPSVQQRLLELSAAAGTGGLTWQSA